MKFSGITSYGRVKIPIKSWYGGWYVIGAFNESKEEAILRVKLMEPDSVLQVEILLICR